MSRKEVVDKFIQDILDRWEKGCRTEDLSLLQDIPEAPGDISFNDVMNELQSRISTFKPRYMNPDKDDDMENALLSARIFARTISFLLKEKEGMGEGLVIKMDDKKYTVFVTKNQVKVDEHTDDLEEGSTLWVHYE